MLAITLNSLTSFFNAVFYKAELNGVKYLCFYSIYYSNSKYFESINPKVLKFRIVALSFIQLDTFAQILNCYHFLARNVIYIL